MVILLFENLISTFSYTTMQNPDYEDLCHALENVLMVPSKHLLVQSQQ